MVLKHRKSLSRLAHLFDKSPQSREDSSHLVWILLSSANRGAQYRDIYDSRVNDIATALSDLAQVASVIRLNNTSPACSFNGSTAASPRASPVSLLVKIDGKVSSLRSTLTIINDILDHGTIINQQGTTKILFYGLSFYKLSHAYSPRKSRKQKAKCMVSVAIEPSLGQEEDIDNWYRKEHLAMLASNSLYLRCNRYERIATDSVGASSEGFGAKFVALHEYTSVEDLFDHSLKKGPIIPETEWTRHILDRAKSVERTIWTICEPATDANG